ncbi:HlyD family efflux transporter periplasmic adaptor subunit [Desulfosporosinus sp. PR]|uniref:efflux RND transporter periplasmic adaptor subunit n=1 Tax=Candidatus Desulfosporosinus nitrosoreducens TaxID=3401928 RepID=UPI0027F45BF6|nr:HlyD family efflux transporter periplasmic adaptor subunit [Desulfosporosinus sp. PR]MDQ7095075.1 HlyD family efflux transporter periplasmic adaptor subunit [Desulfosporosinus sp. PR]
MKKKWAVLGVISVLVLGGGYWGYRHFAVKPAATPLATAKAQLGDVKKVITATGTVKYPHAITLTFPTSGNSSSAGKIVELNVKAGDVVKAGQVLARIDDTKLKTSVLQAEANVTSAESSLQNLKDSFNEKTYADARAALAQAQQSLTSAQQKAAPSYLANQVTLAEDNVQLASDNLASAQQSGNSSSIQSAQNALSTAMDSLTSAQNLQNGGAAKALASAQANVVSAQYQVDQQAQGPKAADLNSSQANIQIAQASLASAQADLGNAAIVAPVDAVVVSCPLELGQDSDSTSIITLTPVGDKFEVDASIDQADITECKVGQKADITLDSNPDQVISGTVTSVALQGSTTSDVTTYTVAVTVDQDSDLLRAGMNANVSLIVAQAKNVLTVPSEALKTENGQTGVTVPESSADNAGQDNSSNGSTSNGSTSSETGNSAKTGKDTKESAKQTTSFIPVEIGLDDGTNVEIKSGLKEGQEVITGTSASTSTSATTSAAKSNSNLGGLLGGPGPGGGGPPPN